MTITFHKNCCFKVQIPGISLAIQVPGGNLSRIKSDIIIKKYPANSETDNAEHTIEGPGEYEIKGMRINGYKPSIFLIKAEGIKLAYFSGLTDEKEIDERVGDPDIAIINEANEKTGDILRQLHTKIAIIIPENVGKRLEKDLGAKLEKTSKLTVKKKDLLDTQDKIKLITIV